MSYVARPEGQSFGKQERRPCFAAWKCETDVTKLSGIQKENLVNFSELKDVGCNLIKRNQSLGSLEADTDSDGVMNPDKNVEVFWVEVGKESKTCKVDPAQIKADNKLSLP